MARAARAAQLAELYTLCTSSLRSACSFEQPPKKKAADRAEGGERHGLLLRAYVSKEWANRPDMQIQ